MRSNGTGNSERFYGMALLPILVAAGALLLWQIACRLHWFPETMFPSPGDVLGGFIEEYRSGKLFDDIIASLYRVSAGFAISVALGIPLGLWLGLRVGPRRALIPAVNLFRNLSPLAWIPFAIMWFGIGDHPSIFLIFMTAFFPISLATSVAVAGIPSVYFRVGRDYEMNGIEFLTGVTMPAIMPQIITTLRVTAGLSWVVVVAAEMIAGQDGLGFMIWDARNQLRPERVVVGMILIGCIGVAIDRLLAQFTRVKSVRWGYDQ